jgi:hypothetical protein
MPLVGYCLWLYALPEFRESFGFVIVLGFDRSNVARGWPT